MSSAVFNAIQYYQSKDSLEFDWVIGTDEVVNLIDRLGKVTPKSFTVCLGRNSFFELNYCYQTQQKRVKFFDKALKIFEGPVLLGRLISKSNGFIYLGTEGFLISRIDRREYEFNFLKKHRKKIVCILTGTDIRSPQKCIEFTKNTGKETFSEYQIWRDASFASPAYEQEKKDIARVIDSHANLVFNWRHDQASYLTAPTFPLPFFCHEDYFKKDLSEKFRSNETIVISHCPSDPIIKGTAVVRSVIEMLKSEGFIFEYVELQGVSNYEVIELLERTHILINQLYALAPGVLTIEGLAHKCAVLTSADPRFEELGADSRDAWVTVTPGNLYAQVKRLLLNPDQIESQAIQGWTWALANASEVTGGMRFRDILSFIE
jgi:hypothetical protein